MNFGGLLLAVIGAVSGYSMAVAYRLFTITDNPTLKKVVHYQGITLLLVAFLLLSWTAFSHSAWSHIPALLMRFLLILGLPTIAGTYLELADAQRATTPRFLTWFPVFAAASYVGLLAILFLRGTSWEAMMEVRGTLFLALFGLFHVCIAIESFRRFRRMQPPLIGDRTTRILVAVTTLLSLLFCIDLLRGTGSLLSRAGLNPDAGIVIVLLVAEISLARVHSIWIRNQFSEKQDAITRLRSLRREHRRQAYIDDLTGLPNMNSFLFFMERRYGSRTSVPFSYLLLSIDQFMEIVSKAGIDNGTLLLQRTAELLVEVFGTGVRIFRMYNERFAIVVPQRIDPEDLDAMCGNLARQFEQGIRLQDDVLQHLSVSIGVVPVPNPSVKIGELRQRGILALREAQKTGNTWVVFNDALKEASVIKYRYYTAIRESIEKKLFHLVYQPIVNSEGVVIKAEALLRSRHPDLVEVSPEVWIPIAEQTELIHAITMATWDLALEAARILMERDLRIRISVNLSQKALERGALRHQILGSLEHQTIRDGLICVEITETAVMSGWQEMAGFLGHLRTRGIEVLLDDFGTGYSSLAHMKELPIDVVKLDRRFIRNIEVDSRDRIFCQTILDLTGHLNLGTVAEGIETEGAFHLLKGMGCQNFQGWHFGRPGRLEDLVNRLMDPEPVAVS